jgi:hypothetical protein
MLLWSGFDSLRGLGIFLFDTMSRLALGPTQHPIQWEPEVFSLGIKRPGREADHSPPPSAEIKECVELYLHSLNTSSLRGAYFSTETTSHFTFYKMYTKLHTGIPIRSGTRTLNTMFTIPRHFEPDESNRRVHTLLLQHTFWHTLVYIYASQMVFRLKFRMHSRLSHSFHMSHTFVQNTFRFN